MTKALWKRPLSRLCLPFTRSTWNPSPGWRAQGCAFHLFLDAHDGGVSLLCGTPGNAAVPGGYGIFRFGLMAKPCWSPSFVMLLLDYWPLRRFEEKKSAPDTGWRSRPLRLRVNGREDRKRGVLGGCGESRGTLGQDGTKGRAEI